MTIVQSANSDAEVDALRDEVEILRAEVAAIRSRVDVHAPPTTREAQFDPSGIERRLGTLESQVGVTSLRRGTLTTVWDEIYELSQASGQLSQAEGGLESCDDRILRAWKDERPPFC